MPLTQEMSELLSIACRGLPPTDIERFAKCLEEAVVLDFDDLHDLTSDQATSIGLPVGVFNRLKRARQKNDTANQTTFSEFDLVPFARVAAAFLHQEAPGLEILMLPHSVKWTEKEDGLIIMDDSHSKIFS